MSTYHISKLIVLGHRLIMWVAVALAASASTFEAVAGPSSRPKCRITRLDAELEAPIVVLQGNTRVTAPLVSPDDARNVLLDGKESSGSGIQPKIFTIPEDWGEAFYRFSTLDALHDDMERIRLICEFVRNHIEYEPSFGFLKGTEMTLLDGRGNAFDQTDLLVSLMHPQDANYVYGKIQLDAESFTSWMDITNDVRVARELLACAGIPAEVYPTNSVSGPIELVKMWHMWAEIWVDGETYAFDPSFKAHTETAGIDLPATLGYSRTNFLSRAVDGMVTGPGYLQAMNRTNIWTDLDGYASNVAAYIDQSMPGSGMDDVIGGTRIMPVVDQPWQESLDYEDEVMYVIYNWEGKPSNLSTVVHVTYQGWDHEFTSWALYGRRLSLSFTEEGGTYTAHLLLDGYEVNAFEVTDPTASCTITVDHPYFAGGGTYADETVAVYPEPGCFYVLSFGFGHTGPRAVEEHRRIHDLWVREGKAADSEHVLGESLTMLGLTWLAEASRASEIADRIFGTRTIHHHTVNLVGQEESPFMDIAISRTSRVSLDGDDETINGRFLAQSVLNSMLEGGAIRQLQPVSAVSTVKLLDLAGAQGDKIFDATSTNYVSEVRSNLVDYAVDDLAALDARIAAGQRLILPEHGNLQQNSYEGIGYYAMIGDALGTFIRGGLNGGRGDEPFLCDPESTSTGQKAWDSPDDHPASDDPIDMVTGFYRIDAEDLQVGSGRPPFGLTFARSYNSGRRLQTGPLGPGWTHNWDVTATVGSDGYRAMGSMAPADAAAALGAIYVATDILRGGAQPAADRLMTATLVCRWLLDQLIDNEVQVHTPGRTLEFTRTPDCRYRPPPDNGASLDVEGDGSFLLTTRHGDRLDFDTDGRLAAWSDPNSNTVTLTYTGDVLSQLDAASGRGVALTYDTNNCLLAVADNAGNIFSYDYDTNGNLVSAMDPEGSITQYAYDLPGQITAIYKPSHPWEPYDETFFVQNHYINDYEWTDYDTYETIYDGGTVGYQEVFNGNSLDYAWFDGRGSMEESWDGRVIRTWEYDDAGRMLSYTDPLLTNTSNFAYDNVGTNTTAFAYDGVGRMIRMTMAESNQVEYAYDARGNVAEVRALPRPGSTESPNVVSYAYEPVFNRLTNHVDALGRETDLTYDDRGNLILLELPSENGTRPTFDYTVNARGQTVEASGPEGYKETFGFDSVTGDPVSRTVDPDGLNATLNLAYDAVGNLTNFTDGLGREWAFAYDAARRLQQTTTPEPFSRATYYDYDVDGNLIEVSRETGLAETPWQTVSAAYNLAGLPISQTDPLGRVTTYGYDGRLNLTSQTSPAGHVTEYRYDGLNRPLQMIDPLGNTVLEFVRTPNGGLAAVHDANSNITSYAYDDFDRPLRATHADGSYEELAYDPIGNITSLVTRSGDVLMYEYDNLNRLVTRTLPGSVRDHYTYDSLDRFVSVSNSQGVVSYVYDQANRLSSTTDARGRTLLYEYDDSGNRTRMTYPDGYFITYIYDELNRLVDIQESGTTHLVQYTYDSLSRRTERLCGNGVQTEYRHLLDNRTEEIAWDFMDGDIAFGYTHDAEGRLAGKTVNDGAFLYKPTPSSHTAYSANELNEYVNVDGVPHSYDARGNLIGDGQNTYSYDAQNRLIQVTTPSRVVDYTYSPGGLLDSRTVDGVTTTFVYDAAHRIAEYDSGSNLVRRYIYGPELDDLVLMDGPVGRVYYHQDRMRSVVALSDAAGNRIESYAYDPFGMPSMVSAVGNRLLFCGRPYEHETGLVDFRARFYSPSLGRFLSVDPLGFNGGDMNLYTYARNSTPNFGDPLGLCGSQWEGLEPEWMSQQIKTTRAEINAMELAIKQGAFAGKKLMDHASYAEGVNQGMMEPMDTFMHQRTMNPAANWHEKVTITATEESRGDDFRHSWARTGEPNILDPDVSRIIDDHGAYSTLTLYMPELEERLMRGSLAEKKKTLQILTDEMVKYQQWRHYNEEAKAMWP